MKKEKSFKVKDEKLKAALENAEKETDKLKLARQVNQNLKDWANEKLKNTDI